MSLSVIGAGFPRTGTSSLKQALEQLGFLKCHHMSEVSEHPERVPMLLSACTGVPVAWNEFYAGYQAAVDSPTCHFWKELMDYYPKAKVILSLRDPEEWYESFSRTVLKIMLAPTPTEEAMALKHRVGNELLVKHTFRSHVEDKDYLIEVYNAHNKAVQETVPEDRLLVYRAGEGWQPICEFLDLPIPDRPYPCLNTRDEFIVQKALKKDL